MKCIPHPGETIKEDYLVPLGMSVNQLAKALGVGAAVKRDRARRKGHYGRYGPAVSTLLGNFRRILDESPGPL
jgi:hypothetical protein